LFSLQQIRKRGGTGSAQMGGKVAQPMYTHGANVKMILKKDLGFLKCK
jgi:hypothetical protein